MKRVLILGAAGRDFHNFNVLFRNNPDYQVVAFTATQIPDIAGRRYPPELAGRLYPEGIPIFEEKDLEKLIAEYEIDAVVFSYSDISHQNLMHLASRAVAADVDFWLLGTEHTQLKSSVPVISVCAVRTGCGKSPVSRLVAEQLRRQGRRPVVIRHPMPYGDLATQAVQRFATMEDLDLQQCTIEEREEYEPHISKGTVVYAGVDYEKILRQAEKEADVILWDGGNNDTPFYASDLEIVVVDPHRPGHELAYFPGEVNLRRADVIVINKVDTADQRDVETVRQNIKLHNPKAVVLEMACRVSVPEPFHREGTARTGRGRRSHTHSRRNALRRRRSRGAAMWSRRTGRPAALCRGFHSRHLRALSSPDEPACPPWVTARCNGTNWRKPSAALRAIWC